jgi:hypothetical protein
LRPAKLAPVFRAAEAEKRKANKLRKIGVFGETADANEGSGGNPRPEVRCVLGFPEDDSRECPEKDAQRINGHEDTANREHRNRQSEQDGEPSHSRGEEHPRQREYREAGYERKQDRKKADAENSFSKKAGTESDGGGGSGALVEVAQIEMPRADPVIGFVPEQPKGGAIPKAKEGDGEQQRQCGTKIGKFLQTVTGCQVEGSAFTEIHLKFNSRVDYAGHNVNTLSV